MKGLSRRRLLGFLGGASAFAAGSTPEMSFSQSRSAGDLADAIEAIPVADVHGHAFPALTPITERIFLEELSMAAWQMDAYFPTAYRQWKRAEGAEKERLDREFGIERQLDDVVHHF